MDEKQPAPGSGTFTGGDRDPTTAPAHDSVMHYINRSIDMNSLTGDIQRIVTEHIENSIPDDKKLMLELVSQLSELTGEVKRLRQQLDSKPYAVFTCPSGQIKDVTAELAEIRQLLQKDPKPMELATTDLDPIVLEVPGHRSEERAGTAKPTVPPLNTEVPPTVQPTAPPTVEPPPAPSVRKKSGKKRAVSILGNVLFYAVLICIVVGAFLAKSGSGGQPTVIAGYSAFTVLSSSMEDTYPKGSLIITHSVDANTLEIGDDITYMASATSSITHRIISITENYLGTGARGFETQGTMNENPDKEPVAAANVVGKVVFCSKVLGQAATFVSANWPILLFFVVVLGALVAFLRWNFRSEKTDSVNPKRRRRETVSNIH